MLKLDELYSAFPDAARTLLKRYYGHWRIAPIEELLRQPSPHYISAIPKDLRRIITDCVQDRNIVYCGTSGDQAGIYYTVCGMLHRLDPGPAIDSKNLTTYCQYGVSHRERGAATVRAKNGFIYMYWNQHGDQIREHNMPTEVTNQFAADGSIMYCGARWQIQNGQWKDEYVANGEHVKMFRDRNNSFIATTDLTSGMCEFTVEQTV